MKEHTSKNNKKSTASRYLPKFDSSSSMLFSLGYFLKGKDRAIGIPPNLPPFFGTFLNSLPLDMREDIYTLVGLVEGLSNKNIDIIKSEDISAYAVEQYPIRKYPGVMIGSSNGAATHLCAGLGIPWLPQTVLIAIRRKMGPDDLKQDMEWGKRVADKILENNKDLRLHQMHDPVQDRLMVSKMSYFRAKRLTLGKTYEEFLRQTLSPGGTIYVCECQLSWPVSKISDRHVFQVGGLGDITPVEYLMGSPRVEKFLKSRGSRLKKWEIPNINTQQPEAEWGFDHELKNDIVHFAKKEGYRVKSIVFNHPEDLSPFSADLYKFWYQRRGLVSSRLLIECFALMESLWSIRTRTIPLWLAFNTMNSADTAERYLESVDPYDEIYVILLSNAVQGIGTASIERWKAILKRARTKGDFIGLDEKEFPVDLGSFIRYHSEFKHKIRERHEFPAPLTEQELDQFIAETGDRYRVKIINRNTNPTKP
ncbi:MAG: hypothetical protein WC732_03885 [Candidatus Omnitrophota bacterium]